MNLAMLKALLPKSGRVNVIGADDQEFALYWQIEPDYIILRVDDKETGEMQLWYRIEL